MKIASPKIEVTANPDGTMYILYHFGNNRSSEIECHTPFQAGQLELALHRMYLEGAEAAREELLARTKYYTD